MRLSELMSGMDLADYPKIALVIFLGVFTAVTIRLFSKKRAKDYEEASRLPLED